ncbi:MAG: hybrid sensor histidine kinase/response regulator [Candidatus Kapabacteria bacterium]|nr:hybrid sensor histidine kinase/response regulator [Candidatus Kapabacteria bacterium]
MVSQASQNIDTTMLELFAIELESHSKTLERGLLGLETNCSPRIFESLMRAAHSIKGAARIIGLNKAVKLAHEMEDIFENARKNDMELSGQTIQTLLECSDFYSSLLNVEINEIPDLIDNKSDEIEVLISNLKSSPPAQKTVTVHKNGKNGTSTKKDVINPTLTETQNYRRTPENIQIDSTLMDLFKSEIFSNSKFLIEKLLSPDGNLNTDALTDLHRAVHSIKGASRIVGIEESFLIGSKLENIFDEIISGKSINVNLNAVEYAVTLLSKMPDSNIAELIKYFRELDIESIINNLDQPQIPTSVLSSAQSLQTEDIKVSEKEKDEIINQNVHEKVDSEIHIPNSGFDKKEERFVRVLSENLNRLLGLTGEILVQTKSLKPFSKDMQKIKVGLLELNSFKEQIYQELYREGISDDINAKFHESSKQLDFILSTIINYIENFENFSRRLEMTSDRLYNEAVETRMKPFSEGVVGFPRLVRDVSRQLGKKVELEIKGENTKVDRDILEKLEAPLNHLIRNAIDHGLESGDERIFAGKSETGKIILEARHSSGMLLISISDDGKGINVDNLRKSIVDRGFSTDEMASSLSTAELYDFLFLPGFSTRHEVTEISGRGVGLDVVFSMVNVVGGVIKVDSEFGKGTIFQLQLPLTLSVIRTMLVEVGAEPYAVPLSRIDRVLTLNRNDIKSVENLQYIEYGGENIGIVNARQIFGLGRENSPNIFYHVVILSDRLNRYGLAVDKLISQPDLVVMPLDRKLGKIPNISSGAILEDGTPVLILDVDDVVRSIDRITKSGQIDRVASDDKKAGKKILHILVVDDSLTVREVERKLLENRGYYVTVAIDGIDGWNTLHRDKFDLIISDIDMPRMNGIEMVRRIKSDPKFREIPVMIVSYKDREEDRRLGLEAGANYYLTKSSFHDDTLLEAVIDLIGKP